MENKKCQKHDDQMFLAFFTEMMGFEPMRRRTDLPDFESGPFSHLGTSPVGRLEQPNFIL